MSPYTEHRHHPRVSVEWPVLYSTPSFSAPGTVIDVSALAWRVEGSMPVQVGMQIAVQVWPNPSVPLEIQEARVLWARKYDFALEIFEVCPEHAVALMRLQEQTLGQNRTETGHHYNSEGNRSPHGPSLTPALQAEKSVIEPLRVLEHCHVRYQQGFVEEGLLQDLSTDGCKFLSRASLTPGSHITVTLYFNDGQPPMSLSGAIVRWATGRAFGVQFLEMTSHVRQCLQEIVTNEGGCLDWCHQRITHAHHSVLGHWNPTSSSNPILRAKEDP